MAKAINLSRRRFLAATGAAAGAAGMGLGFSQRVTAGASQTKLLVYIFLRGGMDGLSFVIPTSGSNFSYYAQDRNQTFIDPGDSNPSRRPLALNSAWGLHPFCGDLWDIRSNVAFIHACGHPPGTHTRSHFDAQEQIELGTPGEQSVQDGFLTRHLQSIAHDPAAIFTSMVASSNPPISLAGYPDVATLDSPSSFHPNSGLYGDTQLLMLQELYNGAGSLDLAGQATLDAVELINSLDLDSYLPAGGVSYPNTSLGRDLELVAQLWKLDLGIAVATVDVGGWDTHNGQQVLNFNGGYGGNVRELSEAVAAFYLDVQASGRANDLAVVIQSEFGRQIKENGDFGTDHGLGNPMAVIGGGVTGGLYRPFPGLAPGARIGDSVEPLTDFRRVHATVLDRLMGNPNIDQVFPGFSYTPIGFA